MSLQIIAGASGSGKSTYAYERIIKLSMEYPEKQFFIIVPDQFSMSTTREILRLHPRGAITNIDVLSFSRLTHRIADEVGQKKRDVLDDTGKNLILRRVSLSLEDQLGFLKGRMRRTGYVHEVKSQISEFYQYDISLLQLDEMIQKCSGRGYLPAKLKDLKLIYEAFGAYIREKYITTEEALLQLRDAIPKSRLMAGSYVLFDNFTGFTPIQNLAVKEMLKVCEEVSVILCADGELESGTDRLFSLAQKTYDKLIALAGEVKTEVLPTCYLTDQRHFRYAGNPPMAFLEKELLRFGNHTYRGGQDAIRIFEAVNLREEVQNCCGRICELIRRGYQYRDIAIVTGDTEGYGEILREELTKYRIPFYMDTSRSVLQNPLSVFLRFALRTECENYSYESVMGLLSSYMTDLTPDEINRFDRYLTEKGIRGKHQFSKPFERGEEAPEIEPLRQTLCEILEPLQKSCKSASDWALALYEICLKQRMEEKCLAMAEKFSEQGEPSLAKEYEKIFLQTMKVLEQIHDLIGEDELSCREFLEIFEAGISEIRIGTIPQKVDQVVVGDIQRTRLDRVSALFFLGINEGNIPKKNASGGLLSDIEREFLTQSGITLAPGPREKLYEQRLYLYQIMTKPAEQLYLSYALLDAAGKGLMPSYLIGNLLSLYPDLKIESIGSELSQVARIATPEDGLDDLARLLRLAAEGRQSPELTVLSALYGDERIAADLKRKAFFRYEPAYLKGETALALFEKNGTVSRLELMAGCRFAHFIRYGLRLREKKQFRLEVTDQGSVYHKVLELFMSSLKEKGIRLEDLDEDEIWTMLHELMEQVITMEDYRVLRANKRNEFQAGQMEQLLRRSIDGMQYHFRKGKFHPAYFEHFFKDEEVHHIRGVIDRIDLAEGQDGRLYVKVVDYKSGKRDLDLTRLYYGISLQLPIYLSRAVELLKDKQKGTAVKPAAMLYYRLQDPLIAAGQKEEIRSALRKEMICKGLILEDDEVLRFLDAEFEEKGYSDVVSVKRKKDGGLYANSQTASEEEMKTYLNYALEKADALQEEIQRGDIAVNPITIGSGQSGYDSCQYCSYADICGFDETIEGYCKKACKGVDAGAFTVGGEMKDQEPAIDPAKED
ncbi:MAG: PD-(D/E)XK nuclease family protein [Lachnospiraceae bacterium]|nr:PD-(D/E)XK nuclease family protein [Lachnospiraceae bacterium]